MLSKQICDSCQETTVISGWLKATVECRNRFWNHGLIRCPCINNMTDAEKSGEVRYVDIKLWAGDPLPVLGANKSWNDTVDGRNIELPPPPWCKYALEHLMANT